MRSLFLGAIAVLGFSFAAVADQSLYFETWDEYGETQVYIKGLQEDLLQNLVIKDSRGPAWADDAIMQLDSRYDFHEATSYYYERFESSQCPEMTDEEFSDAMPEYEFRWKAVKQKFGSQKSVLYIVENHVVLTSADKTCELLDDEFVFQAKRDANGKPVYVGRRSLYPRAP